LLLSPYSCQPLARDEPEKVEISVHDAHDLYKEIRIENTLEDSQGVKGKIETGRRRWK